VSTLHQVEKLLPSLSRSEKAELLKRVVQELGGHFPGIDTRPDTCGGEPCVGHTRIPIWVLEQARRQGSWEEELLRAYPSLRAEDLANAWAYIQIHLKEIDDQIRDNESA